MQAVRDMFADPTFRSLYEKGRNYTDPASYFASNAFRAFDGDCHGRVGPDRPINVHRTVMLQFGGDGVSLLNFGQRTATVIGVRCEELPPEFGHSRLAWRPVIVVEGPKEPSNLSGIMARTIQALQAHGPVSMGGAALSVHVLMLSAPWGITCQPLFRVVQVCMHLRSPSNYTKTLPTPSKTLRVILVPPVSLETCLSLP